MGTFDVNESSPNYNKNLRYTLFKKKKLKIINLWFFYLYIYIAYLHPSNMRLVIYFEFLVSCYLKITKYRQ